jgi:SAM-dependent methyltransferase
MTGSDRPAWLAERRRQTEERFDTRYAPTYDDSGEGQIGPAHRQFVEDLVGRCPPGGRVLDAACGTGKYFGLVLDAGRRVAGADQSAGMLAKAGAKHPDVPVEKVGLQELAFDAEFDAAMCVDAMEYVFPEDWPLVLANLRRALRPGAHLYLTVERTDERLLAKAFAEAVAGGLPVVHGEDARRGGGYHYYPPLDLVGRWLREAGLSVVRNQHSPGEDASYSYVHLLLRANGRDQHIARVS